MGWLHKTSHATRVEAAMVAQLFEHQGGLMQHYLEDRLHMILPASGVRLHLLSVMLRSDVSVIQTGHVLPKELEARHRRGMTA